LGDTWEDRGKIYTPLKFIDTLTYHDLMQGDPQLAANDSILLLILRDQYPYCISSKDNGNTWTKPIGLKDIIAGLSSLFVNDSESIIITFTSGKHTGRQWWGYIPLWWTLAWDANPSWYNNDLYYTIFKEGIFANPIRLTHRYSYVGGALVYTASTNEVICLETGDKTMIFWPGKRKMMNDLNNIDIPYEIFYKTVSK
jgi:hypothetical protein